MTSISLVWDRTTGAMDERKRPLVRIAALTIFLPAVASAAIAAYRAGIGAAAFLGLVSLVALLLGVWAQLAITALMLEPARSDAEATRAATRRFGAALLVMLVILAVVILAAVPIGAAFAVSGVDVVAMSHGVPPAKPISPGTGLFVAAYLLVFAIAALLVWARLVLVIPVVLKERLAIGAIRRSWELTHGITWKIVGALLLFMIVMAIASSAAQFVTGILVRLIAGPGGVPTASFLAQVAGAVVTTLMTVIAVCFAAQLYLDRTGRRAADAFR